MRSVLGGRDVARETPPVNRLGIAEMGIDCHRTVRTAPHAGQIGRDSLGRNAIQTDRKRFERLDRNDCILDRFTAEQIATFGGHE